MLGDDVQFSCNLEHVPEVHMQVQQLASSARQEQGPSGPWLSPAMLGDTVSPLHSPDNCSSSHSTAGQKSGFGSC